MNRVVERPSPCLTPGLNVKLLLNLLVTFTLVVVFFIVILTNLTSLHGIFMSLYSYTFIPILYMFLAPLCSSSGESIVLIQHLVYVNYVGDRQVCRFGENAFLSPTETTIIATYLTFNNSVHCMLHLRYSKLLVVRTRFFF